MRNTVRGLVIAASIFVIGWAGGVGTAYFFVLKEPVLSAACMEFGLEMRKLGRAEGDAAARYEFYQQMLERRMRDEHRRADTPPGG